MLSIGKFFERIQNVRAKEVFLRQVIQEMIKKTTSIEIPLDLIQIKSAIITLKNTTPALRSELFIKKETVIREINAAQQIRTFTDLR